MRLHRLHPLVEVPSIARSLMLRTLLIAASSLLLLPFFFRHPGMPGRRRQEQRDLPHAGRKALPAAVGVIDDT